MARLVITDKAKPGLKIIEPGTRRRITSEEIEKDLGADCVATIPSSSSPMSAYTAR